MTTVLMRARIPTGGGGNWTTSTLLRRLRNPALMGLRVREDKNGGVRRSRLVLGRDGNPIKVADAVFTEAEWQSLQNVLDARTRCQPARRPGGATEFLGILVCADCGTNMTVHRTLTEQRAYSYLRCRGCRSGGRGAPAPETVYTRLLDAVTTALGAVPVRVREYLPATEPGPQWARGTGTVERDRWVMVGNGDTFRDRWKRAGRGTVAEDLRRAGVTCTVRRKKVPGARAPEVQLVLIIPDDVEERLVIKNDAFADR
ncbi:recombinase zinc beta ribbon domain-containing protein [Streptomyces sp. NPDC052496]|uniref:recombinase zinc beta ribbon domain-containing protein n=1 Tax=Streptomyces sp. NPDC052496 TaxID=3154951 RepID=UPI003434D8CD